VKSCRLPDYRLTLKGMGAEQSRNSCRYFIEGGGNQTGRSARRGRGRLADRRTEPRQIRGSRRQGLRLGGQVRNRPILTLKIFIDAEDSVIPMPRPTGRKKPVIVSVERSG
jgi:hypothetical protein